MSTLTLFPTQILNDTTVVAPPVVATSRPRPDAGLRQRLAPLRLFAAVSTVFALIHLTLIGSGLALEVVLGMEALSLAAVWLVISLADRVTTLAAGSVNLLLVLALVHPATGAPLAALMLQAAVLAGLLILRVSRLSVVWEADDFRQFKGMF